MAQLLLLMFFILTAIGLPIGFMLGVTALIGFEKLGNPVFLTMLSQRFFSAMNSYTFLAIPLFFLAGDIMTKVGLTERIVSFANVFFGRLRREIDVGRTGVMLVLILPQHLFQAIEALVDLVHSCGEA